jgi:hypothetical protein
VDHYFADSSRNQAQNSFGKQEEADGLPGVHQPSIAGSSQRCIDADHPTVVVGQLLSEAARIR